MYDYSARMYSPVLGRFISPDSIIPNPANPQSFNRYSYVLGNVVNYTDPTGHYTVDSDTGECFGGDCDHYIGYIDFDPLTFSDDKKANLYEYVTRLSGIPSLTAGQRFSFFLHHAAVLYRASPNAFMGTVTEMVYGINLRGWFLPFASSVVPNIGLRATSDYFVDKAFDTCDMKSAPNKCSTGWRDEYRDKTNNQAYHFWFYVAVAYADNVYLSHLGNFYHDGGATDSWMSFLLQQGEGVSKADYDLGVAGANLGSHIQFHNVLLYGDPLTTEQIATMVDELVLDLTMTVNDY